MYVYPDNFGMANDAFTNSTVKIVSNIIQPKQNGFYTFFENWQSRNSAQESASGLAHARLVVGQYKFGKEEVFVRHGYDLVKPPEHIPVS